MSADDFRYLGGWGEEPGHALRSEGRIWDKYGNRKKVGPARCRCGWESPALDTDSARKVAHRDHKGHIRRSKREGGAR